MFQFLGTFAVKYPIGFWECINPEFVLQFLFADYWAVPGYALDFIRKVAVLAVEAPEGFVETIIHSSVSLFGMYERCVQDSVAMLMLELVKQQEGLADEIEAIVFAIYPKECSATQGLVECLRAAGGGSSKTLKYALAEHIKFNCMAVREEEEKRKEMRTF
jgi:hypothetical protein